MAHQLSGVERVYRPVKSKVDYFERNFTQGQRTLFRDELERLHWANQDPNIGWGGLDWDEVQADLWRLETVITQNIHFASAYGGYFDGAYR